MFRKASLLLLLLAAVPLLAADLGKYTEWPASPQAYFLTAAERTEWATLRTEADAEQFVARYIAARGGEPFAKELATRIAMADKYLTLGGVPGSKTLRGKVVILLGPPAAMDVAVKPPPASRSGGVSGSLASASGDMTGPSVGDVAEANVRRGMTGGGQTRIYTFTFAGANLPSKQDVTVAVEVNTANGKDRVADKKAAAALEELFKTVAQASVKSQ